MAIAIVPSTPKIQFTYEDYLELPDDGRRYEIIDGELYMATAPSPNHQKIVRNFLFELTLYLKKHLIGEVIPAPLEVFFSQTNLAQPDIVYISDKRSEIIKPDQILGAPDLVIEVLSPSTEKRDRTVKLKMYAKFGVQEYWMAKEKTATVEIYRLQKGELVLVARLGKSDVLTSPLFPGLEIPLDEIFNF
jgi:Uma2 family endonuclease